MADQALANSYKQYKAGTTKIVSWLANTARGCQDVTPIIPSLRDAKNAAKQSKRKQKHPNTTLDAQVTVTTSQLLRLAKVVVQASISIPEDILRTMRAVIAGRSIYAEWYTSCTISSDVSQTEHNSTHRYFIDVLKEIQRLLENSAGAQTRPKSFKPTAPISIDTTKEETLSNIFSNLQLHEPLENALGSAPAPTSKPSASKVQFELEEPENDTNFGIWCLLQDLRDLRLEVRNMWMEYRDGRISFGAVTEMTVNAVAMAQCAELQFVKQYPDAGGYTSILRILGLEVVSFGPNTWLCAASDAGATDVSKGRLCGDAAVNLLCPRAYLIFTVFVDELAVRLGNVPRDQKRDLSQLLDTESFGRSLRDLLPRLDWKTMKKFSRQNDDPLLDAARILAIHHDSALHTWMVVACQMHMDMHDIMGSSFMAGIREAHAGIVADVSSARNFCETKFHSASSENPAILRDCQRLIDSLARSTSYLLDGSEIDKNEQQPDATDNSAPYKCYDIFPVQHGMLLNVAAMGVHHLGVNLCNYFSITLSVAYLYRAALMAGSIQSRWLDMDFVIEAQGDKRPLVLEPQSIASMARCFGLALGAKLKDYAKGRRPPLPKVEHLHKTAKMLEVLPSVDGKQFYRFTGDLSQDKIAGDKIELAVACLDKLDRINAKDGSLEHIFHQYKSGGRLTLVQLLLAMKKGFITDEANLRFNYIDFYQSCEKMMRKVATSCAPELDKMKSHFANSESLDFEIVDAILWDAADRSTQSSGMEHSILNKAGKVMEQWIAAEGDKETKLARARTSGHCAPPPMRQFVVPPEPQKDLVPVAGDSGEDMLEIAKYIGIVPQDTDHSEGGFFNSQEVNEARIFMHNKMVNYIQQPDEFDTQGLEFAGSRIATANRQKMTPEEIAVMEERIDRVLTLKDPVSGMNILERLQQRNNSCSRGDGKSDPVEEKEG